MLEINSTLIIYLYLFLISIFVSFSTKIKNYNFTGIILVLGLFILFCTFQGLGDWRTYSYYASRAFNIGTTYFEKGFDYLLYLSNLFGSFYLVPFFTILTFTVLFINLQKYLIFDKNTFFIVFISFSSAFLPLYFGALRQACSSNFILISIFVFYKQKYFKSIIYAVLSILFHHSAILMYAIIISCYIYFSVIKYLNYSKIIILTIFSTTIVYYLLRSYVTELFEAFDISYRLGNADNYTSNDFKDILILIERLFFTILCFVLFYFQRYTNSIQKVLFIMSLAGNLFYCSFFMYARNMAGRTLAFFRYLDIYVLYEALCIIIPYMLARNIFFPSYIENTKLNRFSFLICIIYFVLKYYTTIYTVSIYQT